MRALFTAALIAAASVALAHTAPSGWSYGNVCCNPARVTPDGVTGDCAQIAEKTVTVTPTGYIIKLMPGDHPLVTEPQVFRVPFHQAKVFGDEHYHICLYPMQTIMRCFFAPPRGA